MYIHYGIDLSSFQNRSLKHAANELVNHAVRFYIKPDDILVILARIVPSKNKSKSEKWRKYFMMKEIQSAQNITWVVPFNFPIVIHDISTCLFLFFDWQ